MSDANRAERPSARPRSRLPEFGLPGTRPEIPRSLYAERLERLRARAEERGYDRLLVFADREHSANMAWLTGFDPRFEEALVVVAPAGPPAILVGNECWGMAGAAPLPMERYLFQDFSLPGQPRNRSLPLGEILGDLGIGRGGRVGIVGWKTARDTPGLEVPAFLVDELRRLTGPTGAVESATDLLIDAGDRAAGDQRDRPARGDGIRVVPHVAGRPQPDRIAPARATGKRCVALLGWNGMPLSCHLMLTAGPRATLGLLSPGDRPIERGDRFTVAFGVWGALTCRAGFVVESERELPEGIRDYVERLVGPYFAAIAEWYSALRIGVTGGVLDEIISRHLGDPFFGLFLNAGHQIQLDEWLNSPMAPDSQIELRSGMAFQVDVIPATGTEYFTTNIEDGVALADAGLRASFAAAYPEAWARIRARRRSCRTRSV